MDVVLTLLIMIQVELILVISILIYHVIFTHHHHKKNSKKDELIKHVKDYISEGFTLQEVRKKLEKIGFSENRINKVLNDFLKE